MLIKLEQAFKKISWVAGRILSVLLVLMVLNVFYDVVMRYFFHNSSVGMQEMEWHLFAIIILFGISVALLEENHVRVDFLYDNFSVGTKAIINITGTVLFLIPLSLLILWGSLDFVIDAYQIKEISQDPGGLPFRWIIKGMIPLSFAFLILCSFGYTIKNINLLRNYIQKKRSSHSTLDKAGEIRKVGS